MGLGIGEGEAGSLFVLAEFLVISPHGLGETIGHRIAIDRRQRVFRIAAGQFFGDAIADLHQRLHDLELHDGPIRFLLILPPVTTQHPRPFPRGGKCIPHFGRFNQVFHIPQAFGPLIEVSTGQWTDAPAFPAAKIRRAVTTDVENIIELETTSIGATPTATLISAALISALTRLGDLTAIALSRLIGFACVLLTLSGLLALAALLATTLLAARLCGLLL